MRKWYIIFFKAPVKAILVLLIMQNLAFAQQKNHLATFSAAITWQVEKNNYKGKPASLSTLNIKTGNAALPASGWRLYLNFARNITRCLRKDVEFKHVNGDLYYLSPKKKFKGLAANSSLSVSFISSEWVVNYTDAPEGLFLVFDNAPQQAYPLALTVIPSTTKEQARRVPADKIGFITPEQVYAQNELIKDIPADSLVQIFPTPDNYTRTRDSFTLTQYLSASADPRFTSQLSSLKESLLKTLNVKTFITAGARNVIALNYSPVLPAEGYDLQITGTRVIISASTATGMYYGIQSFLMLMPVATGTSPIVLPGMQVSDKPRFAYRAVMLDVARNFQPKDQVKKLINLMGLYKLNKLHIHLTDDEGWRLEIKELPELTTYGAKRGYSITDEYLQPSLGSGPDVNNQTGTGFYTREDFIDILKHAKLHHIEIIPEIESPGHARAAIKAMDARYTRFIKASDPEKASQYLLRDLADSSKYLSVQSYNDNVINVALPSAYLFMQTVTDAIIGMYREAGATLTTIHFGGDEVPAGVWERSPVVKKFLAQHADIESTDGLWSYFYGRLNAMLKQRNLYLTAWEEVGLKKKLQGKTKINVLNDNMTGKDVRLEVWNNIIGWGAEDLAYHLANNNYKVILSCVTNLYFDMAYEKNFYEPGYYWGGYTDADEAFKFIPMNYLKNVYADRLGNPLNRTYLNKKEKLTEAGAQNIVGIQGALWAETIKSPEQMEYMLLPKLLGLAERAWAKDPDWAAITDSVQSEELYKPAFSKFINIVSKRELPRLDNYATGFNYRIPQPGAVVKNGAVTANIKYKGFVIRYTTDGTEPDNKSAAYTKPIAAKGMIKLRGFNQQGRGGQSTVIINK